MKSDWQLAFQIAVHKRKHKRVFMKSKQKLVILKYKKSPRLVVPDEYIAVEKPTLFFLHCLSETTVNPNFM